MTDGLPTEGKVVVTRPDAPDEIRSQVEAFGIPLIVSEAVPKGMMFVVDLDMLYGHDPHAVRTMRQAEEMLERMREFVEQGGYPGISLKGID